MIRVRDTRPRTRAQRAWLPEQNKHRLLQLLEKKSRAVKMLIIRLWQGGSMDRRHLSEWPLRPVQTK